MQPPTHKEVPKDESSYTSIIECGRKDDHMNSNMMTGFSRHQRYFSHIKSYNGCMRKSREGGFPPSMKGCNQE